MLSCWGGGFPTRCTWGGIDDMVRSDSWNWIIGSDLEQSWSYFTIVCSNISKLPPVGAPVWTCADDGYASVHYWTWKLHNQERDQRRFFCWIGPCYQPKETSRTRIRSAFLSTLSQIRSWEWEFCCCSYGSGNCLEWRASCWAESDLAYFRHLKHFCPQDFKIWSKGSPRYYGFKYYELSDRDLCLKDFLSCFWALRGTLSWAVPGLFWFCCDVELSWYFQTHCWRMRWISVSS